MYTHSKRAYYLHHNNWITVQLVERMKNVAGSSTIIDVNDTTVSVGSDRINVKAQQHKHKMNK